MTKVSSKAASPEPDWRPEKDAVAALVAGRHGDPFAILGPHKCARGVSIRVMAPAAESVEAIDGNGRVLAALDKLHDAGFFAGLIQAPPEPLRYRLRFKRGDAQWEEDDTYRFPIFLGEM
ncbi:MAG: 1,4-alpha-glucan branching enzyme, partial [Methylocystis sp.]